MTKAFFNKRPILIAEISANHNGDLNKAKKLISLAKENGADAVKLQTFTPSGMTLNHKGTDFKIKVGAWKDKYLWDLYLKAQTKLEWHKELFAHAKKNKIICFSAPFHEEAVDFFCNINPQIDKFDNKLIKLDEEGCLSIPGLMVSRERYDKIKIRYYDIDGQANKTSLSGFLSKLFQHELDHLNGNLMIDELEKIEKIYPLESSKKSAKKYGNLFSQYQKLVK